MSTEAEQSLERTVAVRRAHRGVLTRLVKEAKELLESSNVSNESYEYERLQILTGLIEAKGKLLESLDENVLVKAKIEDIEYEVNESSLIAEKVIEVRRKINNLLKKCSDDSSNTSKSLSSVQNSEIPSNNAEATGPLEADSETNTQESTSSSSHTVTNNSSNQHTPAQLRHVKVAKPRLPNLLT